MKMPEWIVNLLFLMSGLFVAASLAFLIAAWIR
jgi:hypothetical protein